MFVDTIDKKEVEDSIANWKERIANLYADMQSWFQGTEYELRITPNVCRMNEIAMIEANVPETYVDMSTIFKNNVWVMSFNPEGLWVVSCNGLIDILSKKGSFKLSDRSEIFNPPIWKIDI